MPIAPQSQGILNACWSGVGAGLGGLLGGLTMQRAGCQALFIVSSAVVLTGWLLCWAVERAAAWRSAAARAGAARVAAASA